MINDAPSHLFMDAVNAEVREKLIKLDQKLKIMHEEVETKLVRMAAHEESASTCHDDKASLLHVQQELKDALACLSDVVSMVIVPEQEHVGLSDSQIDQFCQSFI